MFKVLRILFFVCSTCVVCHAQISSKNIAVGIQTGITSNRTSDDQSFRIIRSVSGAGYKVIPTVHYFVNSRFSIGIGIGYSRKNETLRISAANYYYSNGHPEADCKSVTKEYILHPSATYYFGVTNRAYLFLRAGVNYTAGKKKQQYIREFLNGPTNSETYEIRESAPTPVNSWNAGVSPGFLFFSAKHWILELSLGANLLGYSSTTSIFPTLNVPFDDYATLQVSKSKEWQFLNLSTQGLKLAVFYVFN